MSEVLASKTAIDIAGPTFTGGIFNTGVVSGSAGIEIKSAHAVSIFDGGTIIGTGGTAIEFAGSGNTLTLGAGYFISGIVDPQSGNNTFQLGGFGSDTFNLSSIGAAAQYQGFTIFNVVGGTWTVSSASTAHWTIKAGTLEITSGGALTSTTVSSGGVLAINSGATVSGVTIKTGATLELFGGIPLPSGVTIPAGATLGVGGGVYSGLIVSSGHTLKVLSGGTDLDATVRSGGALIVGSDGTDSGATILKGGVEKVTFGGASIDAALKSGGTEIVSAGGVAERHQRVERRRACRIFGRHGRSDHHLQRRQRDRQRGGTDLGGDQLWHARRQRQGLLIDGSAVVSGGAVVVGNGSSMSCPAAQIMSYSCPPAVAGSKSPIRRQLERLNGTVSGFGGVNHATTSGASTSSISTIAQRRATAIDSVQRHAVVSTAARVGRGDRFHRDYSRRNFHVTAVNGSTVAITDPVVANGGSVTAECGRDLPRQASICRAPSARRRLPMSRTRQAPAAATVTMAGTRRRSRSSAITWPEALSP